jgi:hypothetical protein
MIMKKMANCSKFRKKGFSTVVTIFSVLLLILVFIVFLFLFKKGAEGKEVEAKFSSSQTEYVLKTFLRSPAPILGSRSIQLATPDIGLGTTNANLISWTCNNDDRSVNYKTLEYSINTFFDVLYEKDWQLEIIYSNPELDNRGFGHQSWLQNIWRKISEYSAKTDVSGGSTVYLTEKDKQQIHFDVYGYKEQGFGFQVIPCQDGSFSAVMLKAKDYINYKDLKIE